MTTQLAQPVCSSWGSLGPHTSSVYSSTSGPGVLEAEGRGNSKTGEKGTSRLSQIGIYTSFMGTEGMLLSLSPSIEQESWLEYSLMFKCCLSGANHGVSKPLRRSFGELVAPAGQRSGGTCIQEEDVLAELLGSPRSQGGSREDSGSLLRHLQVASRVYIPK